MSEIEDTNTEYGSNSSNSGLQTEKRPSDSNDVWSRLHKAAEDILSDLKNEGTLDFGKKDNEVFNAWWQSGRWK